MSLLENTGSPYVATRIIDTLDAAAEEFRNVEDGFDRLRHDISSTGFFQYEVATFTFPGFGVKGAAVSRKVYLFKAAKQLAFWSPELPGWVMLSNNMG